MPEDLDKMPFRGAVTELYGATGGFDLLAVIADKHNVDWPFVPYRSNRDDDEMEEDHADIRSTRRTASSFSSR